MPAHCTVFNHLPTADLQTAIARSEYIVSRSGYTTVMEMMAMQKKSVLVPTPGQTEQEYLAAHLMQQQWCFACRQEELSPEVLKAALQFSYLLPGLPDAYLPERVAELIKGIGREKGT